MPNYPGIVLSFCFFSPSISLVFCTWLAARVTRNSVESTANFPLHYLRQIHLFYFVFVLNQHSGHLDSQTKESWPPYVQIYLNWTRIEKRAYSCLFLFPIQRVMDAFLIDGMEIIFRLAVAILNFGKEDLLSQDMEGMLKVIFFPKHYNKPKGLKVNNHLKSFVF